MRLFPVHRRLPTPAPAPFATLNSNITALHLLSTFPFLRGFAARFSRLPMHHKIATTNNARQITDGFTYYTYKYNGFSL
ncbi:MAG: hypothetical protein ACRCVR_00010, partial [Plesiomonas shigelloides]